MGFVYYRVRAQAHASKKWSLGKGAANGLQTRVFYQCAWYVLSFLISWPILFAVYLASIDVNGPYGLTLIIAMLAPLQGFNNFCVYLRPKLLHWKTVRDKRRKKQKASQAGNVGHAHLSSGGTTTHMHSSFQNSSGLANRRQVVPSHGQELNRSVTALDGSETERGDEEVFLSPRHKRNAFALEFSESEHDPAQLVMTDTADAKQNDNDDEDGYVDPSVEIVEMNEHATDAHADQNSNSNVIINAEVEEISQFRSTRPFRIVEEE